MNQPDGQNKTMAQQYLASQMMRLKSLHESVLRGQRPGQPAHIPQGQVSPQLPQDQRQPSPATIPPPAPVTSATPAQAPQSQPTPQVAQALPPGMHPFPQQVPLGQLQQLPPHIQQQLRLRQDPASALGTQVPQQVPQVVSQAISQTVPQAMSQAVPQNVVPVSQPGPVPLPGQLQDPAAIQQLQRNPALLQQLQRQQMQWMGRPVPVASMPDTQYGNQWKPHVDNTKGSTTVSRSTPPLTNTPTIPTAPGIQGGTASLSQGAPNVRPPASSVPPFPPTVPISGQRDFATVVQAFMAQRGLALPSDWPAGFSAPSSSDIKEVRTIDPATLFAKVTSVGGSERVFSVPGGWSFIAAQLELAVGPPGEISSLGALPNPGEVPGRLAAYYTQRLSVFEQSWMAARRINEDAGASSMVPPQVPKQPIVQVRPAEARTSTPAPSAPATTVDDEARPAPVERTQIQLALQQQMGHLQQLLATEQITPQQAAVRYAAIQAQSLNTQSASPTVPSVQSVPPSMPRAAHSPLPPPGTPVIPVARSESTHSAGSDNKDANAIPSIPLYNVSPEQLRGYPAAQQALQMLRSGTLNSIQQQVAVAIVRASLGQSDPMHGQGDQTQLSPNLTVSPAMSTMPNIPAPSVSPSSTLSNAIVPGTHSPGTVPPGSIAPGMVAPSAVTPGVAAPGQMAPGQVAPGQVAPGQVALGSVTSPVISPSTAPTGITTPGASGQANAAAQGAPTPNAPVVTMPSARTQIVPPPAPPSSQTHSPGAATPSAAPAAVPPPATTHVLSASTPPQSSSEKLKVEYVPWCTEMQTYGGRDLARIENELFSRHAAETHVRGVNDLGTVDVYALCMSLRSRLDYEVSYALNTLLILSAGVDAPTTFQLQLAPCEDLLDDLLVLLVEAAFSLRTDTAESIVSASNDSATALHDAGVLDQNMVTHANAIELALEDEAEMRVLRRGCTNTADEKDAERHVHVALAILAILRNSALITDNAEYLGRHPRFLKVMAMLARASAHDPRLCNGNQPPNSPQLTHFTLRESLRVRKDILGIVLGVSGESLDLSAHDSVTVASLLDVMRFFVLDASDIEERLGATSLLDSSATGMRVNINAYQAPYHASVALQALSRFLLLDSNREVVSAWLPDRIVEQLVDQLVYLIPIKEVDFQRLGSEPRLEYLEGAALCLYALIYLASPEVKTRLRRRAGLIGVLFGAVKRLIAMSHDYERNPYMVLCRRLVETLRLLSDAQDMFGDPPLLGMNWPTRDNGNTRSAGASCSGVLLCQDTAIIDVLQQTHNVEQTVMEELLALASVHE